MGSTVLSLFGFLRFQAVKARPSQLSPRNSFSSCFKLPKWRNPKAEQKQKNGSQADPFYSFFGCCGFPSSLGQARPAQPRAQGTAFPFFSIARGPQMEKPHKLKKLEEKEKTKKGPAEPTFSVLWGSTFKEVFWVAQIRKPNKLKELKNGP